MIEGCRGKFEIRFSFEQAGMMYIYAKSRKGKKICIQFLTPYSKYAILYANNEKPVWQDIFSKGDEILLDGDSVKFTDHSFEGSFNYYYHELELKNAYEITKKKLNELTGVINWDFKAALRAL